MDRKFRSIADDICNLVNSFDFNSACCLKKICEGIAMQHKTLQQNFTRLCFAWIKYVATSEHYSVDDRNKATKVKCDRIYQVMSKDSAWDFLPFI